MRLYANINNELIEPSEITFLINELEELHILKNFLGECISKIEKDKKFEHEHFKDYIYNNRIKCNLPYDIVVYKE